jgi:DNA-binding protein H-NS
MRKLDFNGMEFEELWELHEQLTKILADKLVAEKRQLEDRLERLNRVEIIRDLEGAHLRSKPHRTPRRKYPKVLPKYQNPLAPSQTWSGRGKQPRWFVAALETGHRPDDLRLDHAGKAKQQKGAPNRHR